MARKNPLGKIKDLTVETLKSPRDAARQAVDQAKGAASIGRHLAGQATSLTAGAVGKLVQGKKPSVDSPAPTEHKAAATPTVSTDKPVNVTEELGLDPAPVARKRATPSAEPVTSIDAQAVPEQVSVTPADIAAKVSKQAPARKPATKKAPAAKKTPAKKTAPGAKLPARTKVETADQAEATTDAGGGEKG